MAKTCLKPAASTHGGNPVSAAAALASIAFHREQGLGARARSFGGQLRAGLGGLSIAYPGLLGAPRGLGLMVGVPVRGTARRSSSARCDALLESLKVVGVLAGRTGPSRDVLAFLPPLVIAPAEVRQLVDAVDEAAAITLAAERG
jgi:4-aminobutyrate aminotransferase-like enzyme